MHPLAPHALPLSTPQLEAPIRATYRTVSRMVERFTTEENWSFFYTLTEMIGCDEFCLQDRVEFRLFGKDCESSPLVQETLKLVSGWKLVKLLELIDNYCVDPPTQYPCCFRVPGTSVLITDMPTEWLWDTEPDYLQRLYHIILTGGYCLFDFAEFLELPESVQVATLTAKVQRTQKSARISMKALWIVLFVEFDLLVVTDAPRLSQLAALLHGNSVGLELESCLSTTNSCCHAVRHRLIAVCADAYLKGHSLPVLRPKD